MEPSTFQSATSWLTTTPLPVVVGALIAAAVAIAVWRRRGSSSGRNPGRRDPERTFPASVRSETFTVAKGRCEFDGPLPWVRCRRRAEHADHFFPWAFGGASSAANCVAACALCNLRKGAKMPSVWLQRRIARRRRRYAQAGAVTLVGQWFGRIAGQR